MYLETAITATHFDITSQQGEINYEYRGNPKCSSGNMRKIISYFKIIVTHEKRITRPPL